MVFSIFLIVIYCHDWAVHPLRLQCPSVAWWHLALSVSARLPLKALRLWGSDSPTPLSSITTWWKGLSARLFHWLSALTFYFSPDISRFLDFSDLEWCSYSIPVNTKPMLSTLNLAINQTLALCKLCSPALALRRPNHLMRCSKPGTRKATKESCQYLCGFNKSKSLVPFHSISDSKNACILGS